MAARKPKRKNARAPKKKTTPRKKPGSKPCAKSKGGRPSKFTPEIQERIFDIVSNGGFYTAAAEGVGISRSTLNDWLNKHKAFSDTLKKALSNAESASLKDIRDGVERWQSRAWYLERRFRARWGVNAQPEDTGEHGVDIVVPAGHTTITIRDGDLAIDANNPILRALVNGDTGGAKPELDDPNDI